MILEELVTENKERFLCKVKEISELLSIDPDWLMVVMAFESNIDHKAVNRKSGATGLIQFMPATARSLGTTIEELKSMSNVEQLDYVYLYLKPYKGRMKTWVDVYLAVFYPAAIGKPDYVITKDIVAKQNKIFDLNKDLDISVKEIETVLRKQIPKKYKHLFY